MNLETVLKETESWSVDEQIELAERVWDRIADSGYMPPLGEALKAELGRRIAEHKANPGAAIPWEQVKAELLARARQ